MPNFTGSLLLAIGALVALLGGCQAVSPSVAALALGDIDQLDALTAPAMVFPDAAQRALYEMHVPTTENGRRSYTFELRKQPGMVVNRHFHLITITWAPGDTFGARDGEPRIKSTFGPGGGLIDVVAQTADRRFDVQVSEAMLLPDSVQLAPFDSAGVAASLVRSYRQQE